MLVELATGALVVVLLPATVDAAVLVVDVVVVVLGAAVDEVLDVVVG